MPLAISSKGEDLWFLADLNNHGKRVTLPISLAVLGCRWERKSHGPMTGLLYVHIFLRNFFKHWKNKTFAPHFAPTGRRYCEATVYIF